MRRKPCRTTILVYKLMGDELDTASGCHVLALRLVVVLKGRLLDSDIGNLQSIYIGEMALTQQKFLDLAPKI
jgi:hypothetical protein